MASRIVLSTSAAIGLALLATAAFGATSATSMSEGLSSYRAYASSQAELLMRMTRMMAKDIRDGDVEAARNDYAATHRYLERIRPVLAATGDLAKSMDAGAAAWPGRERDPDFSGFHRIEHGLYAVKSTQGLAPVADRLYEDTLRLQEGVATQPMRPELLVDGPVELAEAAATIARDGGREPYALSDLWDVEANLDGARDMVAALGPRVEARDPLARVRIAAAFAKTNERLAQLRDGCGFKTYDRLTQAERTSLAESAIALSHELAKLKAVPAID